MDGYDYDAAPTIRITIGQHMSDTHNIKREFVHNVALQGFDSIPNYNACTTSIKPITTSTVYLVQLLYVCNNYILYNDSYRPMPYKAFTKFNAGTLWVPFLAQNSNRLLSNYSTAGLDN